MAHAAELVEQALRKRLLLPSLFTYPVLIESLTVEGDAVLASVRCPDGRQEDVTLEVSELEVALQAMRGAEPQLISGEDVFSSLEATRIRLAYYYDQFFAVSLSGVRALPHQLEAVYEHLLPQPRLRFVLAHDPGAGKTIMAGLLIKELKLRGAIERILILVPSPLTPQWQDELLEKFDETFEVIDSHVETGQLLGNVWQRKPQCIASLDYAKRDSSDNAAGRSVRDAILQCSWDLVIVDEAHKASASRYGDDVVPTKRYKLIEELSRSPHVHHMLLLTATPHQGKEEQFRLFLRLLDPDQFEAQDEDELKRMLGDPKCPFFMRRVKEDLRDFDGQRLFLPRHAWTVDFQLTGGELALYNEITRYIQEYLGKTYSGRRRMAVALARSVLQRRLASSLHAIAESLRRRLERLSELLTEVEKLPPAEREKRLRDAGLIDVDEEASDDDRDEGESDRVASQVTVAESVEGLRREVAELRRLHADTVALRDAGPDEEQKLRKLYECLQRAQFAELKEAGGKLLIFTEHRDTLSHLEKNLRKWGYSVVTIHGGHNAVDRKERRRQFEQEDIQVCIATDAAGEGINLQFCHLMINYDVPWNPNRLEQRMGRIHRIGQRHEVHVFNFVAVNTEEGKVLYALLEKIKNIRESLNTDRIFDVIGTFLRVEGLNVEDVLREAAVNPRRAADFIHDVEKLSKERVTELIQATDVSLARKQLDLNDLHRRTQLHEDLRLMPEYVERFFGIAAKATGLELEQRADGLLRVPSVPRRFRAHTLKSVQRFGPARDRYLKATFRKDQKRDKNSDAELLSPGHPLYAAVVELFESKLGHVEGATSLFFDPRTNDPYYLHFFEISVAGEAADWERNRGESSTVIDARFVPIIEHVAGPEAERYEEASQDILHDLTPLAPGEIIPPEHLDSHGIDIQIGPAGSERARKALSWVRLKVQHPMVKRQQALRTSDAKIRREYLERAFDARLHRLKQTEFDLLAKSGEQGVEGRLSQLRDEIQQTELRRVDRLRAVDRLAVARSGAVRHMATIVVLPAPDSIGHTLLRSDPEVERIAMEFVLAEEVRRGWEPKDVHDLKDGRGYDILSYGPPDGKSGLRPVRRIEVKGRSTDSGDVALTRNEWIKAGRLRIDYWLYVVYNARPDKTGTLRLLTIQDPANALAGIAEKLVVVKGYLVPGSAIVRIARPLDGATP